MNYSQLYCFIVEFSTLPLAFVNILLQFEIPFKNASSVFVFSGLCELVTGLLPYFSNFACVWLKLIYIITHTI